MSLNQNKTAAKNLDFSFMIDWWSHILIQNNKTAMELLEYRWIIGCFYFIKCN